MKNLYEADQVTWVTMRIVDSYGTKVASTFTRANSKIIVCKIFSNVVDLLSSYLLKFISWEISSMHFYLKSSSSLW